MGIGWNAQQSSRAPAVRTKEHARTAVGAAYR